MRKVTGTLCTLVVAIAMVLVGTTGIASAANTDKPDVNEKQAGQLSKKIDSAKSQVQDGQSLKVTRAKNGEIWVAKYSGTTRVVLTTVKKHPNKTDVVSPSNPANPRPSNNPKPDVNGCAAGYAIASVLYGIGSVALGLLAVANPEGVVIAGTFFTASQLGYASAIAGSYATLVGWVGTFVC